jgi:exopolysaccharide biosynthesis predicted pyruvyltransferase EpsI
MNSLAEIMEQYKYRRVFFEPVGGNHGDTLIELGSRYFLSQYRLDFVDQPELADLIIVNGSGSFAVELWNPGLPGLKKLAANFPALPMIVLPSSFQFFQSDFASCFCERTAPAYLFARDAASYERIASLKYPSEVIPSLQCDMTFELAGSPFLETLKKSVLSKHILVIERFDREATTHSSYGIHVSDSLKKVTPAALTRFVKKGLHLLRRRKSGFTSSALARLLAEFPEYTGLPVIAEDVSSNVGFTFDQFIQLISQAAVVISNRLHAAILAAMLNKTTIVLSGHPYGKLEACYDYSLRQYPKVYLW